jgi:Pvc16 N-terminal domain/Carboxypeptidase regulatory-like domain
MIEALDETIRNLLVEKVPLDETEVDISFEVPNRDWSKAISKPTLNIYLHDIRENVELRQNEWSQERTPQGLVTKTKLGGRFDMSYIITAWTTNPEDEHRLLWYVLATLSRYSYVPLDIIEPALSDQPHLMLMKVAQPDSILRNTADVWTALDNQLKPVITMTITIGLPPHINFTAPEVRTKFIRFAPPLNEKPREFVNGRYPLKGADKMSGEAIAASVTEGAEQIVQVGGRVTNQDKQPVRAEVILLEQGLNTRTDELGRYSFGNIVQHAKYTFIVVAPGYETARREISLPSGSYDIQLEAEAVAVNK